MDAPGWHAPSNDPYIIVDTNVLLSALLFGGTPEMVFRHVLATERFITSEYIVQELASTIKKRRPGVSHRWLALVARKLSEYAKPLARDVPQVSRDIKDDPIIALALEYNAVIITGDKDLLEYPHAKPPVLTVGEYAELFVDKT